MEKLKIMLNNQFYDKNIIKEAIMDFKEVCDGKVLNDDVQVELMCSGDSVRLRHEFCNYVLGLMKNKMLV